jgi:hypothetical protein
VQNGIGCEENAEEGFLWYKRAAETGYSAGMFNYANAYETGVGVEEDMAKAEELYLQISAKNETSSMYNLAAYYDEVKNDPKLAFQYFRKAAELGDDDSIVETGLCYLTGSGVDPDLQLSVKWFLLGAWRGEEQAAEELIHIIQRTQIQLKNSDLTCLSLLYLMGKVLNVHALLEPVYAKLPCSVYVASLMRTRNAVLTWLWLSKQINCHRDVGVAIGKQVYATRTSPQIWLEDLYGPKTDEK